MQEVPVRVQFQFAVASVDTAVDEHDMAVLHALHHHDASGSLPVAAPDVVRRSCLKSETSKRKKRSIRFCDKGHLCEYFDMYDEDLHPDLWFTPEAYEEMKSSFEFTIFMMDAGCPEKVEDNETVTTRGLEKRTEEGQWKRYERKREYYNEVLDEQERQWDADEDDHDKIGEIAVSCTRQSFHEAHHIGVLDEIAVYGHSLRTVTKKRQSQLQSKIDAISEETTENGSRDTHNNDNLDPRKEDTSDTLTVSTINDSSSNFSENHLVSACS